MNELTLTDLIGGNRSTWVDTTLASYNIRNKRIKLDVRTNISTNCVQYVVYKTGNDTELVDTIDEALEIYNKD